MIHFSSVVPTDGVMLRLNGTSSDMEISGQVAAGSSVFCLVCDFEDVGSLGDSFEARGGELLVVVVGDLISIS